MLEPDRTGSTCSVGHQLQFCFLAKVIVLGIAASFITFSFKCYAAPADRMMFDLVPPLKPAEIFGNAWWIFAHGVIDSGAPSRLQALIDTNNIPDRSFLIFDSPGGDLFAGMKLGRVARAGGFHTEVGTQKVHGGFEQAPGRCFSACALSFLGGSFRFISSGSDYGVHRFAFLNPSQIDGDRAQIVSALVQQYIREMGVDDRLFSEMSKAGKDGILILSSETLQSLGVVNGGRSTTKWTIESASSRLYLKGHQESPFGERKLMITCDKNGLDALAMFDPVGRGDEIAQNMGAVSFTIDGTPIPFQKKAILISPRVLNSHWVEVLVHLDPNLIKSILSARSVGVVAQYTYQAAVFAGFNNMDFAGGRSLLIGLMSTCR